MSYRRYPAYRDSGVEWIGEVPSGWPVIQLRRTVSMRCNGFWGAEPDGENDVLVIRVADFDYEKLGVSSTASTLRSIAPSALISRQLTPQSLLLEKSGGGENQLVGRAVIAGQKANAISVCSNFIEKLEIDESLATPTFVVAFLNFLYAKKINFRSIKQSTGIQNLDSEDYLSNAIALPPLAEQKQIAAFLDRECGRMDALQGKQERLIELLKEKRQAQISHAVTRGLTAAQYQRQGHTPGWAMADPKREAPEMKDSGVEWLGANPTHWLSGPLKFAWNVIDCKHITATFVPDGIPLASIGEVRKWEVDLQGAKQTTEEDYSALIAGGRKPTDGDILFTRNATVGEASMVVGEVKFAMGQDVCLMKKQSEFNSKFLLLLLKSPVVSNQLDQLMIGSTFKRVNVEEIRNLAISSPPLAEQNAIVAHLDETCAKIDSLIDHAESAIALLKERRTALISAAVTGKIDVREVG